MKDHPLTPMTDANLVRVLQRQTKREVGLVPHTVVREGAAAIRGALRTSSAPDGVRHAIVDALEDADLLAIGAACADLALVTGGSGVALGLPENFRRAGLLSAQPDPRRSAADARARRRCSPAAARRRRRRRSRAMNEPHPAHAHRPARARRRRRADRRSRDRLGRDPGVEAGPCLVYSTAAPDAVRAAQEAVGKDRAATLVEDALAAIAEGARRAAACGGWWSPAARPRARWSARSA